MKYKYSIRTRRSKVEDWRWVSSRIFTSYDQRLSAADDMTGNRWRGEEYDYASKILLCKDEGDDGWRELTDDEKFMFFGISPGRPKGGYF